MRNSTELYTLELKMKRQEEMNSRVVFHAAQSEITQEVSHLLKRLDTRVRIKPFSVKLKRIIKCQIVRACMADTAQVLFLLGK